MVLNPSFTLSVPVTANPVFMPMSVMDAVPFAPVSIAAAADYFVLAAPVHATPVFQEMHFPRFLAMTGVELTEEEAEAFRDHFAQLRWQDLQGPIIALAAIGAIALGAGIYGKMTYPESRRAALVEHYRQYFEKKLKEQSMMWVFTLRYKTFFNLPYQCIMEALSSFLTHPNPRFRVEAVQWLGWFVSHANPSDRKRFFPMLLQCLQDPHPPVRMETLGVLKSPTWRKNPPAPFSQVIQSLETLLGDSNALIRAEVVRLLTIHMRHAKLTEPPDVRQTRITAVKQLENDPSAEVRSEVQKFLKRCKEIEGQQKENL